MVSRRRRELSHKDRNQPLQDTAESFARQLSMQTLSFVSSLLVLLVWGALMFSDWLWSDVLTHKK